MRIVAQDGTVDLPYEKTALIVSFASKKIIAVSSFNGTCTMAKYSTEANVKKVMQLLRDQYLYLHNTNIFYFPTEEELEKIEDDRE